MQAVIKTGGKQYRVSVGSTLKVEKLNVGVGDCFNLEQVLMVSDGEKVTIGAPFIKGAQVKTTVLAQDRSDKVLIFKMRRRKHSRKTQGHRQSYTKIQVDEINL